MPNHDSPPLEKSEICPTIEVNDNVYSRNGGQWTKAHFRNDSGKHVLIYFVQHEESGGELNQKAALAPGDSVTLETIEGHVFIVIDEETGRPLLRHTVGNLFFDRKGSNDPAWDNCQDDEKFEPMWR